MKILFIGARVVGFRCLEALLKNGANIAGLLTLDDSKASITTAFQSFDALVSRFQLNSRRFTDLNSADVHHWADDLAPDLGIVIGVSQLVSREILAIPPMGFIGMHPTLLPEGRGRAPIPWAIIKGLKKTGASLFYCEDGADTGDLIAQQEVPVYYEDTSATLGRRTDETAMDLLVTGVQRLKAGTTDRMVQDDERATVWPRRRPEDGLIDWRKGRRAIYDWVRALTHPYPGAFTTVHGRHLWVWAARESLDQRRGRPGEVITRLPHGLLVSTRDGNLLITRVQWKDGMEMDAADVGIELGTRLGN